MFQIAVIGTGQIGSRHLQGIALSERDLNVFILDKDPDSIDLAKQRLSEMNHNDMKNITFHYIIGIEELPDQIDLAIIATGSNVRKAVTEELLGKKKVSYLLLEKILFDKIEDYDIISKLIKSEGVKTWVNCPRRMSSTYESIRASIKNDRDYGVVFQVSGGDWGLGCNGIHYLDLFCYLLDQPISSMDASGLDNELSESKRKGFIEFTGSLRGTIGPNSSFELSSVKEGNQEFEIIIKANNETFMIKEAVGVVRARENNCESGWKESRIDLPYQSQLTHNVLEQILSAGTCNLTPYEESAEIHIPLLSAYMQKLKEIGQPFERCCIT